jgi:ABC-2 type transport system permease protein
MSSLAYGLVRKTAFVGKELTEVRRQPRLLLSLVLGPFLILFLFGIGYSASQQDIKTVVVLPADSQYPTEKERYADAFAPPFTLDAVTKDAEAAQRRLQNREVGIVVYFPANAYETIAQGQRATLGIRYNEINPLQAQWLQYYSYVQTNELNKRVLIEALKQNSSEEAITETKNLATALGTDAGVLRDDLRANNRAGALGRVETLRRTNGRIQQNVLSTAQLLGGVALFTGIQDPLATPQGQALSAAQDAISRTDSNLTTLQTNLQAGRAGPEEARLAEQIQQDAAVIDRSTGQLRTIPPEILVSPFQTDAPRDQNIAPIVPGFVEFYAPAVIALLIQHIAVTLTALTLVRERLLGSVELFRVSPTSASEITMGKYVSYFLITAVLGAALAAVMHLGLGAHILAGYELFALSLALLIVASLSFGFFISAISNSESQAVQLSMLVLLASVFFGGFFLGLESLAPYVRVVSYSLPVTYGIRALQAVMLRGEPPPLYALAALAALALGLFAVSTLLFRRQFRRA